MVERIGGRPVRVQTPTVEGAEAAVGAATQIGHHHVTVEMGVQGATDPVHEPGRRHRLGLHRHESAERPTTDRHGAAFHVVEGGVDRSHVRGVDVGGHLGWAQGVEHAHRLRRAEAEVETGHRDPVVGSTQTPRGHRVVAAEHRPERVAVDLSS